MTMYLIAEVKVTNDSWVPDYARHVHELVARHGGTYLSRSGRIETLEGTPRDTTLIAIIAFPSRAAVEAFANDPDYARFGKARQAGSISTFRLIDDTDIAGTIPYLAAG